MENLINISKCDEFWEFPEWVNFEKEKVTGVIIIVCTELIMK